MDWEKHFPFEKIRPQQREAIDFILDAFLVQKKKIVVAELPVGSGKSAIAMTVAKFFQEFSKKTYFLTTQKVLQQQYVRDFEEQGLMQLKSANSYTCQRHCDAETKKDRKSCLDIKQLLRSKKEIRPLYKDCQGDGCVYQQAKQDFFDGYLGVTNYAYALATNAHSMVKLPMRDLLVMDEGHNINDVVTQFVQVSFSNRFYKKTLDIKMPKVDATQAEVFKWLTMTCRNKLRKVISDVRDKLQFVQKDSEEERAIVEELEELEKSRRKLDYFLVMYDEKTWVLDISKTDTRGERIYAFKPLDVARYVRELLLEYAEQTLVLSATIIDIDMFCETNGFDRKDVAFISLPSQFPIENRIVNVVKVGSMSRKNIEKTLPSLIETINILLDGHAGEKGIIHANSFKIVEYLLQNINNSRLLAHDNTNRNDVLQQHLESSEPTVLLSPSMTEGVDLFDALSRFQIICKTPYPYLGDAVVVKKMEQNPDWYSYQTAKTLVQALGRSVRSETDYAVSYILDSDFVNFYNRNNRFFPHDFERTLRF